MRGTFFNKDAQAGWRKQGAVGKDSAREKSAANTDDKQLTTPASELSGASLVQGITSSVNELTSVARTGIMAVDAPSAVASSNVSPVEAASPESGPSGPKTAP